MRFVCNTGYSVESCRTHLVALHRVLSKLDVAVLGEWTWVLVRSESWRPILRTVGRDPDSPAFTILEKRQTFLEEALFETIPGRSATLLEKFRLPLDRLREHAVLHELGHAICAERDERRAHDNAEQLRRQGAVPCGNGTKTRLVPLQHRSVLDVTRRSGQFCSLADSQSRSKPTATASVGSTP
jgi:hypothetical protein